MEGTAFTTTENTINGVYQLIPFNLCFGLDPYSQLLLETVNKLPMSISNSMYPPHPHCPGSLLCTLLSGNSTTSHPVAKPRTQTSSLTSLSFSPAFITKSDCLYILKVPHIHSHLSIFTSSLTLPLLHCLTTEQCIK